MSLRLIGILGCMVAVSGCFGWGEPVDDSDVAEGSPAEQAWIVWWVQSDSTEMGSVWINAQGQPLHERSGIAIATSSQLWTATPSKDMIKVVNCECFGKVDPLMVNPPPVKCVRTKELPAWSIEAHGSAAPSLKLGSVEAWDEFESNPERELAFLGSVGQYLFVTESVVSVACGAAHGETSSSFQVYDLSSEGKKIDLIEQERNSWLAQFSLEAFGKLKPPPKDLLENALEISLLEPLFNEGKLSLSVQLTIPTCSGCGDGVWSTSTVSTRQMASILPAKLEPLAEIPLAVKTWQQQQSNRLLRGWSTVDPQAHEQILKEFNP